MASVFLAVGLCYGCASAGRADRSDSIAARLGYQGCKLSKPLTKAQAIEKDMSGGYELGRPHPDWDELIRMYASGDDIYFIDCRRHDPSSIVSGTAVYALVRNGVVIARAQDTNQD